MGEPLTANVNFNEAKRGQTICRDAIVHIEGLIWEVDNVWMYVTSTARRQIKDILMEERARYEEAATLYVDRCQELKHGRKDNICDE